MYLPIVNFHLILNGKVEKLRCNLAESTFRSTDSSMRSVEVAAVKEQGHIVPSAIISISGHYRSLTFACFALNVSTHNGASKTCPASQTARQAQRQNGGERQSQRDGGCYTLN